MKISRIEHIGIAVQSIAEVLPYYKDVLGLEVYKEEVVEDQKVKTAFLQVGEVKLELLEPTCPESTIQKFLDNGGKGVHHVAFKVEDGVTEALAMCDEKGIRHAGIDFVDAPAEDAKYMLVSCSAFVNYLIEKWSKIGDLEV